MSRKMVCRMGTEINSRSCNKLDRFVSYRCVDILRTYMQESSPKIVVILIGTKASREDSLS